MFIFEFIFKIISLLFNTLNVDFFGFGFGYLDLILGCSLAAIVIKFFLQGLPGLSHGNITESGISIARNTAMSHEKREREIVRRKKEEQKEVSRLQRR